MKRLLIAVSLLCVVGAGCKDTPVPASDAAYIRSFDRHAPTGDPLAMTNEEYLKARAIIIADWKEQRVKEATVDLALEVVDGRRREGIDLGK